MNVKTPSASIEQHNVEIQENLLHWQKKPVLRAIYRGFHDLIASHLPSEASGKIVELGSGIGNIKDAIPDCVRTDLFPNPWIDQTENAYALSFPDQSVRALILFDVFHHLRYPGTALKEFQRVLAPGGRVIIFEPYISALGLLIYGAFHHEPVALRAGITPVAPAGWDASSHDYYAAQGNATRIFFWGEAPEVLGGWRVVARKRLPCLSYVASGGYTGPQLYPDKVLPVMLKLDQLLSFFPILAATRTLVVLER